MKSAYLFILGSALLVAGCALVPRAMSALENGIGAGFIMVGAALYALTAGRALSRALDKDLLHDSQDRIEIALGRIEDQLKGGDDASR